MKKYVMLKDKTDVPLALFEIERETAKRFYGKIADRLDGRETNFWHMPGYTSGGYRTKTAYVTKDIVFGPATWEAWSLARPLLCEVRKHRDRKLNDLGDRLEQARQNYRADRDVVNLNAGVKARSIMGQL